jgi:dCMP deaminase
MRGRNIWVQPDNTYDSENESISSGSLNMYGGNMYGGNMAHNNLDTTSSDEEEKTKERQLLIHLDKTKENRALSRPSWNDYFCEIVCATSRRSPCHRLQVGCILVKDNRIISQGYNGFLPGCPHRSIVRDGHEQATVHAEQNALCDCAKRGVSSDGSTAYITHYPCVICTRLLLASGISNIYYINDYKNDELVELLCKQKGVNLDRI